jgi:hypothetical protein
MGSPPQGYRGKHHRNHRSVLGVKLHAADNLPDLWGTAKGVNRYYKQPDSTSKGAALQIDVSILANDDADYTGALLRELQTRYGEHGIQVRYADPLSAVRFWSTDEDQPAYRATLSISGKVITAADGTKRESLTINSPNFESMEMNYALDKYGKPEDFAADLNDAIAKSLQKTSDTSSNLNHAQIEAFDDQIRRILEVPSLGDRVACELTAIRGSAANALKWDSSANSYLHTAITHGCATPRTFADTATTCRRQALFAGDPARKVEYHECTRSSFESLATRGTEAERVDAKVKIVSVSLEIIQVKESAQMPLDLADLKRLAGLAHEVMGSIALSQPDRDALYPITWQVDERLRLATADGVPHAPTIMNEPREPEKLLAPTDSPDIKGFTDTERPQTEGPASPTLTLSPPTVSNREPGPGVGHPRQIVQPPHARGHRNPAPAVSTRSSPCDYAKKKVETPQECVTRLGQRLHIEPVF